MSHENVTFNDNGTVTAVPYHPLVWVPELSIGDHENDVLILPNIAILVSKLRKDIILRKQRVYSFFFFF